MTDTILVLGAGGFVGGTIVEALFFANKYDVHAGIARWSSAPRIARMPITLKQCDVLKPDELAKAFVGVDYIIHCAVSDDERVTIDGTYNVINAAIKAGVKRLVYISSVAVYGQASGYVTETTQPPANTLTSYGTAKRKAEHICEVTHGKLDIVMLRPTIIYGPFSARWSVLNALRLKSGRWKHLGTFGNGLCNLVHVQDVARYAIAGLFADHVAGRVFNINGPEVITWNEYYERFNQQLRLPPLSTATVSKTKLSASLIAPVRIIGKYVLKHHPAQLRWLGHKSQRIQKLMQQTELTLKCTPNHDELALFQLGAQYECAEAERAFGFAPQVGIDEGLAMTVAWLDHMGET